MNSASIRIVLAEDHSLVREGTRRILEEQPDMQVVGEAEDGEQAVELVERLRPDVAVLDIRMPAMSGVDVVRAINGTCPETRLLVLSAYADDEYVLALMEAGVSGYLLKTAQAVELVEAVRGVHQGKSVLHPDVAMKVARLWARRRTLSAKEVSGRLSNREMEVLRLAAKGLDAKTIASALGISVRTVNGHFDSIFSKLGVSSRIQAVLQALSRGLFAD
jgi:DNA-binding NarL/FixJ family response regulator